MIIYAKDDVVKISGAMNRNYWLAIKAAANLLLKENPHGIIIDCADLTTTTRDGIHTLLDALRYIKQVDARILVCNVPENLLVQIKKMPGLRSGLAIANSLEEARVSLRPSTVHETVDRHAVLVLLMDGTDVPNVVSIASDLARQISVAVTLFYCIEVPRSQPLGALLPNLETKAYQMVRQAEREAARLRQPYTTHITRSRDLAKGFLAGIVEHESRLAVIGVTPEMFSSPRVAQTVATLIRRAPCDILVVRSPLSSAFLTENCSRRIPLINRRSQQRPAGNRTGFFAAWPLRPGCRWWPACLEDDKQRLSILFALSGNGGTGAGLRFACRYARTHKAQLTVITIVEVPMSLPVDAPDVPGLAVANTIMDAAERIAFEENSHINTEVIASRNTATALLEIMSRGGYNLMIMETNDTTIEPGTLDTENYVSYLMRRLPHPLWLLRTKEYAKGLPS